MVAFETRGRQHLARGLLLAHRTRAMIAQPLGGGRALRLFSSSCQLDGLRRDGTRAASARTIGRLWSLKKAGGGGGCDGVIVTPIRGSGLGGAGIVSACWLVVLPLAVKHAASRCLRSFYHYRLTSLSPTSENAIFCGELHHHCYTAVTGSNHFHFSRPHSRKCTSVQFFLFFFFFLFKIPNRPKGHGLRRQNKEKPASPLNTDQTGFERVFLYHFFFVRLAFSSSFLFFFPYAGAIPNGLARREVDGLQMRGDTHRLYVLFGCQ